MTFVLKMDKMRSCFCWFWLSKSRVGAGFEGSELTKPNLQGHHFKEKG